MAIRKKSIDPLIGAIVEGIENVKGEDITILDFEEKDNAICRFFVICSGNSNTQVKAISDSIEKSARENLKEKPFRVEGIQNAEWILLDYVSAIVHVFQKEKRKFYDIESLWGDMKTLNLEELKPTNKSERRKKS